MFKILFFGITYFIISACTTVSYAGGIVLGGTRLIYNDSKNQVTFPVKNSSEKGRFLVQSWIENSDGKKSSLFTVAPPLYVSNPNDENLLRIIYTGEKISDKKERIFYLNVKSIPAIDRGEAEEKNILMLASITRIKLFLRPNGMPSPSDGDYKRITFKKCGEKICAKNNTNYFLTMARIKYGNRTIDDNMLAPGSEKVIASFGKNENISYRVINDFGSVSPVYSSIINK